MVMQGRRCCQANNCARTWRFRRHAEQRATLDGGVVDDQHAGAARVTMPTPVTMVAPGGDAFVQVGTGEVAELQERRTRDRAAPRCALAAATGRGSCAACATSRCRPAWPRRGAAAAPPYAIGRRRAGAGSRHCRWRCRIGSDAWRVVSRPCGGRDWQPNECLLSYRPCCLLCNPRTPLTMKSPNPAARPATGRQRAGGSAR
jgi:hypothetical protein